MNALQTFINSLPMGFITSREQEAELKQLNRLQPVLVRCGAGRFTCAVQDLPHFIACVNAGGDYVRDVSLPVGSWEKAAGWRPEPAVIIHHQAAATRDAGLLSQNPDKRTRDRINQFNPNDCGGAFDGHQVTSDADSGL